MTTNSLNVRLSNPKGIFPGEAPSQAPKLLPPGPPSPWLPYGGLSLFQSLRGVGRFSKGPACESPFSGKAGLSAPAGQPRR